MHTSGSNVEISTPPTDTRFNVTKDILCDILEMFTHTRTCVKKGWTYTRYPLIRVANKSYSLCHVYQYSKHWLQTSLNLLQASLEILKYQM